MHKCTLYKNNCEMVHTVEHLSDLFVQHGLTLSFSESTQKECEALSCLYLCVMFFTEVHEGSASI